MKKILVASTNSTVIDIVRSACEQYATLFSAEFLGDTEQVASFVDYELPDIKVLDYTSKEIDCPKILAALNSDTWLHYGGVIAVCEDSASVHALEDRVDGILLAVRFQDFAHSFSRILDIVLQNQQFLFNRVMREVTGRRETGTFVCGNDPLSISVYTNFIISYLFNSNRISADSRFNLHMTLMELLTNALEHGNLAISSEEKSEWLKSGRDMVSLIAERASEPAYASRKIRVSYSITSAESVFTIHDDGEGFDWRHTAVLGEDTLHGRGISISRGLVKRLSYNEKGNEVTVTIENIQNVSNTVPGIIKVFDMLEYRHLQVVCRENEIATDLFYMVSGRFAVYSNKKLVTVLTPNDMFIGEMAFLLNDCRTATVVAIGDCRLIKVPKAAFLTLIRKNPHYGIFLSKMLAHRLLRQTQKTLQLEKSCAEKEGAPCRSTAMN